MEPSPKENVNEIKEKQLETLQRQKADDSVKLMKKESENEYKIEGEGEGAGGEEGKSQSTDASENCIHNENIEATTLLKTTVMSPINATTTAGGPNVTVPKVEVAEMVANSNEETEKVAMVVDSDAAKMMSTATPSNIIKNTIKTHTTTTATATTTTTTTTPKPSAIVNDLITTKIANDESKQNFGEFAVPAIPTNGFGGGDAAGGGAGTGAKKRRNNKSTRKRDEKEARNNASNSTNSNNKNYNNNNNNNNTRGATNASRSQGNATNTSTPQTTTTTNASASGSANMKTSVSMTSLPPDDEKAESRDVIKAKLRVERPYNSLKKNIERNVVGSTLGAKAQCFSQSQSSTSSYANHRYSWGSGYSYSSSSLQSNATMGLGSAKDDLWAAIQTNYNYIMDTNLLDSCKEAERHLGEQADVNGVDCEQSTCLKLLGVTQRREMLWHDPKELRKWLREMEERLETAPTLSTATTLSTVELQRCLAEHSVLYHEIVSHARVVSACIRTATERHQGQVDLQQQQQQQQEDEEEQQLQSIDSCSTTIAEQTNSSLTSNEGETTTKEIQPEKVNDELNSSDSSSSGIETAEKSLSSTKKSSVRSNSGTSDQSSSSKIVDDNLERLQNRYHLLYLKAFEVQLWLDGLLRKKGSNTSIADDADYIGDDINIECNSSYCDEDEAAATEDDLNILGSGIDSDITHNSSSVCPDLVAEVECDVTKGDCEDGDDEGEEEDEDEDEVDFGRCRSGWPGRGYNTVLVTFDKRGQRSDSARTTTLTDFEADSESSDWETTQNQISAQRKAYNTVAFIGSKQQQQPELETNSNLIGNKSGCHNNFAAIHSSDLHTSDIIATCSSRYQQQNVADNLEIISTEQRESTAANALSMPLKTKMNDLNTNGEQQLILPISTSTANGGISAAATTNLNSTSTATQTQQKLQTIHNNKQVSPPASTPIKQKSIAVISPNSHNNKSPTVLRKRQQQPHHTDISKFNRSNRKSKNCAVFYFKHLDTDNETNCSSVGDATDLSAIQPDILSSSASQTSEHHLLKSADASSDDDGGWLYSAVLPTQLNEVLNDDGECANKVSDNKGNNNNNHNCITTIIIDGVQSSAVSSSTAITALGTATPTTTTNIGIHSDDSDKENKEAHASALIHATIATAATLPTIVTQQQQQLTLPSSSQIHSQIAYAETQLNPTTTNQQQLSPKQSSASTSASPSSATSPSSSSSAARFVTKSGGGGGSSSSGSGSASGSIYSTRSSSCSSNDLLTEATTATNTTQITQMHFQQRTPRTEMELQIANNCNKSVQRMMNNDDDDGGLVVNSGGGDVGVIISNSLNVSGSNNSNNNNNNDVDKCNKSNNNNNNTISNSVVNSTINNNLYVGMMHQQNQQQQQLRQEQQLIYCEQLDHLNGNIQQRQKNERPSSLRCHPKHMVSLANTKARKQQQQQQQQLQQIDVRRGLLPPRSPNNKSSKTQSTARSDNVNATNVTKGKLSHESIKQLVLEAEHLVRDAEALKTPIKQKQKHSVIKLSSTVKKRDVTMPGPIKQRVQEWLEHQPSTPTQLHRNPTDEHHGSANTKAGDDCEASGEASETDSVPQPGSDTSEGLTESIATCMQTSTNSYGGNSTECFGGSAEPILSPTTVLGYGSSNQSLNVKIVKRSQTRRKSERPWSVSCLSQLTTETVQTATAVATVSNVQTGLATHSISESALDSLSPGRQRASSSSTTQVTQVKACNSKGSLKRRKMRKKKMSSSANLALLAANSQSAGKKTPESGSEDTAEVPPRLTQTLLMKSCESMTANQIREITSALLSLQRGNATITVEGAVGGCTSTSSISGLQHTFAQSQTQCQQYMVQQLQQQQQHNDSGEEAQLMKPNFRVGSYTTAYMRNEKRLGSLAALATYINDDEEEQQGEYTTGTEDHHSSFSETAWDNYQEKYNSENYSEGFDSDAARKLMEFGDDYRNFIDSQSDCCSSLSAANNLDSLSPPRMDSIPQTDTKAITQGTIANSVDHARRRRALDLEYERRRKTLEVRRKSCQESSDTQNTRSPTMSLSSSANAITPKIGIEKTHQQLKADSASRKLDFGMSHSAQSLRRTSESDTSTRRRKVDERRRSSRNLDKTIKLIPATSSSSCDDSDDEKEMRNLLHQSRNRLEDTEALKIRCHLLRPEDYTEIINTCRDNQRCLEAVLRGPPGTVLSAQCAGQTKDLLAAWEDLLGWSENAAAARKMQEEMIILKHSLNKLGNKDTFELLDTEPQIQIAIEALKNDKTELQTYRTNMLRLNASVHSWLTRQERRLQNILAEEQLKEASEKVNSEQIDDKQNKAINTAEGIGSHITTIGNTQEKTFKIATEFNSANSTNSNITVGVATMTTSIGTSTSTSTGTSMNMNTKSTKVMDIHTLINAENEFHKHLKNEVSDMYSAWDDADARINTQLETLTNSLIAWRQLENGLYEFQQALGQDRGTLKGLEGALSKGQATPVELAQNVKVVAKLLSERVNVSQEQLTAVQEHLDPNHILHIAKFTASNGSLSDSGISDGGATSDGGLSERERRLGVLRRLVKQLEQALAPGSEAMKSIAVRMESAEAELKNLQNTCRDLIVRTAATHQNKKNQQQQQQLQRSDALQLAVTEEEVDNSESHSRKAGAGAVQANGHAGGKRGNGTQHGGQSGSPKHNSTSKRNGRRKQNKNPNGSLNNSDNGAGASANNASNGKAKSLALLAGAPDSGDPADDPDLEFDMDTDGDDNDEKSPHKGWAWRIAKAAVPMQLALITFFCAACLMQPNCCDNLNNLSMSFTPQLRYIRGPPPI